MKDIIFKDTILNELKQAGRNYVSGERLSELLSVTRTSIWKQINSLRKLGYEIDSSSRKGYSLRSSPDIISEYEIKHGLGTGFVGQPVLVLEEVDSTNNYAKRLAFDGAAEGTVIIAERQSAGRGRLGRLWNSKKGAGIWMSIVLRPEINAQEAQLITLLASVAVAETIRESTGLQAGIKWPNDILIDGRKVCGILTEISAEPDRVNFVVVGIGINVSQSPQDFPEELKHTATSLRMSIEAQASRQGVTDCEPVLPDFTRAKLVGNILNKVEKYYILLCMERNRDDIIKGWSDLSVTLQKRITVFARGLEYNATAIGITADGRLEVQREDGVVEKLLSGEVFIRE